MMCNKLSAHTKAFCGQSRHALKVIEKSLNIPVNAGIQIPVANHL